MLYVNIQRRDASTSQMTLHLKRQHYFMKKHNAFKQFEYLPALKQTRLNNRKHKKCLLQRKRPAKQQKIEDCTNAKFSHDDPRPHEYSSVTTKLKNAVSSFQQEKIFYFCINRISSTLLAA